MAASNDWYIRLKLPVILGNTMAVKSRRNQCLVRFVPYQNEMRWDGWAPEFRGRRSEPRTAVCSWKLNFGSRKDCRSSARAQRLIGRLDASWRESKVRPNPGRLRDRVNRYGASLPTRHTDLITRADVLARCGE